jgi:hypothetical protein
MDLNDKTYKDEGRFHSFILLSMSSFLLSFGCLYVSFFLKFYLERGLIRIEENIQYIYLYIIGILTLFVEQLLD